MITPGTPEKEKPATSSGQSAETSRQCRPDLHPHAREGDPEVRVVGQQRRTGRGVLAVDHPRVAADALAAAEQLRQPVEPGPQRGAACRAPRRTPAAAGAGSPRGWRPARRRRRRPRPGRRWGRSGRRGRRGRARSTCSGVWSASGQHPVDLVGHVAAQVPGHRLEPGERVDGRPRLGVGSRGHRHASRVYSTASSDGLPRVDVRVDAVGVRLERGAGLRLDQRAARARRRGASPWCGRTGRSRGRPRRTARRAARRSRDDGRPSPRSAPGRARSPGRASGRRASRRRSGGCRARRGRR